MNSKSLWNDQIPEKDGVKTPVNDIAISPDGSKVIAAVGNRVLLYKAENGDLIDSLRGHKDVVYSVSFSADGSRFSSGGADNVVVIWKSSGQGLLKYNHSAPIQRVVYNPCMMILASCSDVDFGLWTPDQKQVTKEKVPSRITAACWSADGSMLALGMLSGLISVRNQQAEEVMRFDRRAPVWSLVFIPDTAAPAAGGSSGKGTVIGAAPGTTQGGGSAADSGGSNKDLLVVGCWDRTYSLYKLGANSARMMTEKALKYYPLSINYSGNLTAKSSYLAISGSNRKVTLYGREGAKLSEVCLRDSWVWCCACHGDSDLLALGTHSGSIELLRMNFEAVHALYRDRYAYRENLTEVIVHHLVTDKKVRIKCKDLIRNLSLYKNKLAVQLSDRVCVYESSAEDSVDMHFRLRREKIVISDRREEAVDKRAGAGGVGQKGNLLCVTSQHLLFCSGAVLELYAFDGQRQKVWVLDADALCMSVDGGPDGKEGVLLGLSSGAVVKVFVDNPFPLEMTRRTAAVVQVDINIYRTILASVDESNVLCITDLRTQEVLFTSPNVVSAHFNSEVEDLICITGTDSAISVLSGVTHAHGSSGGDEGGQLRSAVRASALPELQEQHIQGVGLGFRGQKIYCLNRGSIMGVDVPQSSNMQRALDSGDVAGAYRVACLGATEADWKLLAMRSLRANQLSVAKNAFARLKDTKFLSLIDAIERRGGAGGSVASSSAGGTKTGGPDGKAGGGRVRAALGAPSGASLGGAAVLPPLDPTWQAELLAYEGHHQEAAKVFARAGRFEEAIRLFTDLRRWEDAKMFSRNAGIVDVSELTMQQAKWLQETNDWKGASELFTSMGQFSAAARMIGDNAEEGWEDALLEVARSCPIDDRETLDYCGERFCTLSDTAYAREVYTKSRDVSSLMGLYAKRQMWNQAAKLADENEGKFDVSVFLPYAEWLVSQDRYEEAMQAYKKSQRIDLAKRVLEELASNAVAECRFKDAAYYFWMLSKETEAELQQKAAKKATEVEEGARNGPPDTRVAVPGALVKRDLMQEQAQLQFEYELKADLYFAYANVHSFVTDPFTSQPPEVLFQVARFIVNSLGSSEVIPSGISKANTLYTLARQAMQLGAFKLARHAYDRLSKLQMSGRKAEEVEVEMLLVQAKPVRDDPDHLPVCYRCGSANPLLNPFTNKFAKGDVCTNCGHPFVRSFINFDILPLVEFVPDPSITDEEAIELIRQPPPSASSRGGAFGAGAGRAGKAGGKGSTTAGGWKESKNGGGGADMLTFEGGGGRGEGKQLDETDALHEALGVNAGETDLFTRCLNLTLEKQKAAYTPVKVDADTLLSIPRAEVFVCRPSGKALGKRATFYRNMLPDIPVAISQPCHRFFHQEDFEFAYLSGKRCPYSRLKNVGEYGSL